MTDRTSLIALMDAMKPGPDARAQNSRWWIEQMEDPALRPARVRPRLFDDESDEVEILTELTNRDPLAPSRQALEVLTNLKPSNTKAQLLEGIAEARAILNGDAA